MAAYLSRLHHISLHVSNVDKLAQDLVSKFQFRVFAARLTAGARQLAFRKGAAVFVVNERPNSGGDGLLEHRKRRVAHSDVDDVGPGRSGNVLYDVRPHYSVDTACNVCFEVEDVERSSESLRARGCDLLVPPTRVGDDGGLVTYSVVKSVVGNVCHTLLDTSRYRGPFLPGFCEVVTGAAEEDTRCPVTHFDHVTYACPRRSTAEVMRWYERNFGFQRFFISSNEDTEEGYVLDQDGIGLRLTAMEYWKCSEAGIKFPFKDRKEPDCKFVIAESLPEQGQNQVDTFLEQHKGPGIQHIGLFTPDIVSTAHTMANASVQFFSPPAAYYTKVGKQQEIEEAGHDPKALMQHGILLDTDLRRNHEDPSSGSKRYLLQVFTKPIFSEDTLFLELIERHGATGFGEGNIRALWRSVQSYMEKKEDNLERSELQELKSKQTGQH
ncbi:4-hydroxyphenylpyruvate dioxygenase-like protein isoform X2 [Hemibagrus wyckioides]|uniref:4-hydroxyphenylpyruvate dioxygenase-like protein isoform X2 n=1 Tax=Hemibagrus wyckioides TaxID=337641 RepID=UPI00266B8137|nr:4-hydroxyphenylpyruvate dioxygenase-like protein isoform X2 [Hemibagrus wyckioides]